MSARYLNCRPCEAAADVLRELEADARLDAEGYPEYLAEVEATQEEMAMEARTRDDEADREMMAHECSYCRGNGCFNCR
jgi:hypothetical protein